MRRAMSDIGLGPDPRERLGMSLIDPGCVKTLRGITAPGILGYTVTRRAKRRKNLSSACITTNQISFSHDQDPTLTSARAPAKSKATRWYVRMGSRFVGSTAGYGKGPSGKTLRQSASRLGGGGEPW
jgi:hypothetical protein